MAQLLEKNRLNYLNFSKIAKKRRDFFIANEISEDTFCKDIYVQIEKELSFLPQNSFYESMIEFKRKMENGACKGFNKNNVKEDQLRCVLVMFIQEESFMEARTASGQSDICIPSKKTIIETKLWKGKEYYNSGFPELDEYLTKQNYNEGYYVIFDYNQNDNEIIKMYGEVFSTTYNQKKINVLFIRMNAVTPSQKYKKHEK